MVANLEMNLVKNPQEYADITKEIDGFKMKKNQILNNPDSLGMW